MVLVWFGLSGVFGANLFKKIEGWIAMDICIVKGMNFIFVHEGFLMTSGFTGTQFLDLLGYVFEWVK